MGRVDPYMREPASRRIGWALVSLYVQPELIHKTPAHITEVIIHYLRRYRTAVEKKMVIGNVWPRVSLPNGDGIGITQDFLPLLGPILYDKRCARIAANSNAA